MFTLAWGLSAFVIGASAAGQYNDCVLLGPDFPSPSRLSNSSALAQATSKFESLLKNDALGLMPNDTAWGVALFSSKENRTLYQHYYTPPIDIGVKEVDENSIFRIGSVSKVFSVWSFLIEVGDSYFNDPITKYVPELANLGNSTGTNALYDDLDNVKWDEVTLGELASQAAGIPRDPTADDLSVGMTAAEAAGLGFPILPKSEIPVCGVEAVNRPCTRKEMFSYLLKQHPIYPSQHSPAYSNIAFTLLEYAQEAIMGKGFNSTVTTGIIDTLGMKDSSYETTPKSGGVIPGNDAAGIEWATNLGPDAPSGSFYSSVADMVKAGQAILQSTLLTPAETRRWFRPLIQTGYVSTAVGAPWEIRYLTNSNQHLIPAMTKQGDIGSYHTAVVFSQQHDLGWVVLTGGTADSAASDVRDQLFNEFGDLFIPAAEEQAKKEAVLNFNGTYVDEAANSSIVILAGEDGRAGLGVPSLISRGVEVIGAESPLIALFGAGESGRLYPSQLKTVRQKSCGAGTYESRLGFRATFFNETQAGEMEDPCLLAWTALGAPLYGQTSLDDFVFEMGEDGRATALNIRMLRLTLKRQG